MFSFHARRATAFGLIAGLALTGAVRDEAVSGVRAQGVRYSHANHMHAHAARTRSSSRLAHAIAGPVMDQVRGAIGPIPPLFPIVTSGWMYVSPSGRDSGSCGRFTPCASFAYASSLARPGSRIIVLPGRYGAQTVHANGTRSRPIYVIGWGKPVLSRPAPASDESQSTPLLRIDSSSYVRVRGLRLIGMKGRRDYHAADTTTLYGELDISGSMGSGHGIVIRHVSVSRSNFTCIKQEDDEQYEIIAQNRVTDCGAPGSSLEHGIYLSGGHNTVVGNRVWKVTGYGIHCYQTSSISVDHETIRNNWVVGAPYTGILAGGAHERVTGNVVKRSRLGIEVWGGGSLVAHNIIVGATYALSLQGQSAPHHPIVVVNNTFYRSGTPNIGFGGTMVPLVHILNNVFDGGNSEVLNWIPRRGSVIDYNDYHQTAPPVHRGRHSIDVDPMFVQPGKNFRLRRQSPVRDSGVPVRGVTSQRPVSMGAH